MIKLPQDWTDALQEEIEKYYFKQLESFVDNEYLSNICYPPMDKIFKAFELSSFESTKVVIVGQDPYGNEGQAEGLAFSVGEGVRVPPSLVNIFKAIDYDFSSTGSHCAQLENIARQGVLWLNSTLTIRQGQSLSHSGHGWEIFTDSVLTALSKKESAVVFMLWGEYAKSKKKAIAGGNNLILIAPHPSPLSFYRGFETCKHFSIANDFLISHNEKPVNWNI